MRHACVTTTFYPTSEPKWEVRNCTASDAFWWSWREGTGKDSSDFNVPCDHVSGHHHGVVGYRGLPRSPLDPSTRAPSSCGRGGRLKFRKRQVQEAELWNLHSGAHTKFQGEASLSCSSSSRGTIPSLNGILGSHLVTLVVNGVIGEGARPF